MSVPRPLAPISAEATAQRHGRFGGGAGPRLFLLAGAGFAWLIPALWNPTYFYALVIWDGILILAFLFDWLRLPRATTLQVKREWHSSLSIKVASDVSIAVTNPNARDLKIDVMDELAPSPWHSLRWLRVIVPARSTESVAQKFIPGERGDIPLGKVYLRYRSAFDMAERWAVADLQQTVRVYPNFEHAGKHSVYLARSRQIELQMRLMRLRGSGSDFESLREYREGDEVRNICWTASARRGKAVTKTFRVERSQAVWLVLDCGRLMRTRSEGYSKLDCSVDAALCVSQLALYSGDRVGLLAYGRALNQRVLPGRGAAQLRQLVEQLAVVRTEAPEADHIRAAATLLSLQKQRGLIIWITDLAETAMTPEVIDAAGQLLSRHLVIFIVIAQPEVKRQSAIAPDTPQQMYETVAAQEMVFRRELLLGRLREHGALCLEVAPHQLSAAVLNQYLSVKERNLV
ncbi:MAG: DUF58 domain-containing protein [Acidobacteriia bacterium]|nr:DUF58 domain-containing protein [Terriglobia bacterium]